MKETKYHQLMLSFDLDFWYDTEFLKNYLPTDRSLFQDYLRESAEPILNLLEKYKQRATFFVRGEVAEKYPEIIKEIHFRGHEIGVHGYSHKSLNYLSPHLFEEELKKTIDLIRALINREPKSYRAPNFSLSNDTRWALPIISRYKLKCDSSIFPVKTPLYGVPDAPLNIYRISFQDVSETDPDSSIIEIPLAVYSFGKIKIPLAGGIYFRLIPFFLYKKMLRDILKKRSAIIYFHPFELFKNTPKIKSAPFLKRKLAYYGMGSLNKFEKLLKNFQFNSIEGCLHER